MNRGRMSVSIVKAVCQGASRKQFRSISSEGSSLSLILQKVRDGQLPVSQAEDLLRQNDDESPEGVLGAFANLDHSRASRTGFPEAVFAAGKTPDQVAKILDDMARSLNDHIESGLTTESQTAILATRVTREQFEQIDKMSFQHGNIEYHETAKIISMTASKIGDKGSSQPSSMRRVVVATAGTTDMPVAEEAAVVLEAANCEVERIYDVGVAGLHRIVKALPRLQDPQVGCVIVCAGMDGALPSVVGGLIEVPVIAVPTSVGYGVSLGGVSAMLTMLNSCAPGVGVVNIDNGFGAAALAYKCVLPTRTVNEGG